MGVPPDERTQRQYDMMRAKLVGFLEPAARVYQKYPLTDTSDAGLYARAIAAMQAADFGQALKDVELLIERDPENPYFHELHGQILFEGGRAADSVAPHERSLELLPGHPLLLINYARSVIARGGEGDVEIGEEALRDALIAEPHNAFA